MDVGQVLSMRGSFTNAQRLAVINQGPPLQLSLSKNIENKQSRCFQLQWMKKYPWLKYSPTKKGGYCVACVLFAGETVGKGDHAQLGVLVTTPMVKFKKALEILSKHDGLQYHLTAVTKMHEFTAAIQENRSIDVVLDAARKKAVYENRELLAPVIETILLCGRNGLPLRGHRDDGRIRLDVPSVTGEGVFRACLRYRANGGDVALKTLLQEANQNATMISKTTQNEIIEICGDIIVETVIGKVSGFFAVLMDETTDVSGKEQATLVIRYGDNDGAKEDFVGLVHATDLSGQGLATLLLESVGKMGLNMDLCRGLGFDGASAMMGKFRGCASIIQQYFPLAKAVHCFNHRLNLVLSKSCEVPSIKHALSTVNEIIKYIYVSNVRSFRFTTIVKDSKGKNRHRLVKLCATRWVQRHDCILVFVEFLPLIAVFLEDEAESDVTANSFLKSIQDPQFLIALVTVEAVMAHTVEPSRLLQSSNEDIVSAYALINDVRHTIESMRDAAFGSIFVKAEKLLCEVGSHHESLVIPRICKLQTRRNNVPHDSPEEYYRRSVFLPFVDHVCSELCNRFGDHSVPIAFGFRELLRGPQVDKNVVLESSKVFGGDVNEVLLSAELDRWKLSAPTFCSISDALRFSESRHLPNIHTLLLILLTVPVTNAEAERSFSTLKRLKTYLRNTIGQDRLNGLALMCVHNEMDININTVIEKFSQKNRRLMFS
jgi:hypothetical protein